MHGREASWLLIRLLCLTLPAFAPAVQAREEPRSSTASATHRQADVAPALGDDRRPVVQGRLNNGLRYAVLPRRGSEPGVGLLMRVEGGFLAERRPGERGLAHLIEHIAFVSPTRTAPDDLHRFVRIGLPLTFPAPSAGTTSWAETNYFLSSRTTQPADLDTLLMLLREAAGELTFRTDAVDSQRADVMREMAERKLGNDIYASYIAAVAPGSPTDVIQAQNSDDVPTASIETIRTLYHRLYRPENTMVVIVGSVDPAQIKALIQQRFGKWQGVGPVPGRAAIPSFGSDRIAPISYSDFQQGRTTAMISIATPTPPPPPTRRRQAETMLMDMLAIRAVNNRLASARPGSSPGKTGLFIENGEQGHRLFLLWDNFAPGQWQPAMAGLKRTTCDLSTAGLSELEWTTAKQNLVQDLEQRTKDMAKVPNVELAKDLSHSLAAGRGLIPPSELLHHAQTWLPTVSPQAANDWWRRQWHAGVEHLRVESPELAQVKDPAAAIRATAEEAVQDASCRVRRS